MALLHRRVVRTGETAGGGSDLARRRGLLHVAERYDGADVRAADEARWEYAARGPDNRLYPWGDEEPDDSRYHRRLYVGRLEDDIFVMRDRGALPVGSRPAGRGPFGHLDLVGSVEQWCRDFWDAEAYRKRSGEPAVDPEVTARGSNLRSRRGGYVFFDPRTLRPAWRSRWGPDSCSTGLGFRVACLPASR